MTLGLLVVPPPLGVFHVIVGRLSWPNPIMVHSGHELFDKIIRVEGGELAFPIHGHAASVSGGSGFGEERRLGRGRVAWLTRSEKETRDCQLQFDKFDGRGKGISTWTGGPTFTTSSHSEWPVRKSWVHKTQRKRWRNGQWPSRVGDGIWRERSLDTVPAGNLFSTRANVVTDSPLLTHSAQRVVQRRPVAVGGVRCS